MQIIRTPLLCFLFCAFMCGAQDASSCGSDSSECLQSDDVNSLLQVQMSSSDDVGEEFDYWKRVFCLKKRVKGRKQCEKVVQKLEKYCEEHKGEGPYNAKCTDLAKAKEVEEKKGGSQAIKAAVKTCEPAALSVCKESTCPAYCAMTEKEDCDCDSMCEAASAKSFANREVNCLDEKGEKIEKCLEKFYEKMRKKGKAPELAALLREHVVKCVCVNRQEDTSDCYSGSQGIPKGKAWCEFDGTPSWQKLVKAAKTQYDGAAPSCSDTKGNVQS